MTTKLSELTNLEKANQDYLSGLEFLQTSCIKCRCKPDYAEAIPHFKKAADIYHGCGKFEKEIKSREKLVNCFKNEGSFWEEGKEYEKISKVQLNQLKAVDEAFNSILNAFHAYANNHNYDDGIKALTKVSYEFIDTWNKNTAIKILEFAFTGIDKYYHILTLNQEESHIYIYECIDKYIDLLFSEEDYEKSAEISKKSAKMIENDQNEEKQLICKYLGFQAIAELLAKKEEKYQITIEKGMGLENSENELCYKINRLVNVVRQKHKDNENLIKKLLAEISRKAPSFMAKMLNIKFIQENGSENENHSNANEIKTDNLSEEEDLK